MTNRPDPWDDWDDFARNAMLRESDADAGTERHTVRSRLLRGLIWFSLAILPARERWIGWLLDRPHPIVQTHDGPLEGLAELESSLPSGQ